LRGEGDGSAALAGFVGGLDVGADGTDGADDGPAHPASTRPTRHSPTVAPPVTRVLLSVSSVTVRHGHEVDVKLVCVGPTPGTVADMEREAEAS
jgi:hypothetical protein